jgi:hypothetical protein
MPPYKDSADFHRKAVKWHRFLLTARPISYIMLTKKSGWICWTYSAAPHPLKAYSLSSYFLSVAFPDLSWSSS